MTKQVRQGITPTHVIGSTGTGEGDTLGHRALDDFKGDLGLGTSLTQTANNGNGTAAAPAFTFTGDTNTGIIRPAADALGFVTNGSEKVRIDSAGNVGIGTTQPNLPINVSGGGISVNGGTFITTGNTSTSTVASPNSFFQIIHKTLPAADVAAGFVTVAAVFNMAIPSFSSINTFKLHFSCRRTTVVGGRGYGISLEVESFWEQDTLTVNEKYISRLGPGIKDNFEYQVIQSGNNILLQVRDTVTTETSDFQALVTINSAGTARPTYSP
jgi:hypothetical protein